MIPRFTSRLASTALVAVFVLVLAGLAVAHRALTEADRARATLDAEVSAGFVGNFLQVHAEALSSFHGYYFDDASEATQTWARAQDDLLAGHRARWTWREHARRRVTELLGAGVIGAPAWRGERAPGQCYGSGRATTTCHSLETK